MRAEEYIGFLECRMSMEQDWSTPMEMDAGGEGDGDDEIIKCDLENIAKHIEQIFFVVFS